MADFNADGCTDLYSNPVLLSNCAGGFSQVTPGAFPVGYGISYAVADENGDGRADILYTNWTDKKWYVIRSTGDGFAAAVNLGVSAPDGTVWFVLDQNGDGLTDLAFRDDTNSGRLKYHLHNAAAAPADVAVSFTDGFGITQGAAYASIAQSNYTKSTGAVFPEIDIQVPLYVVSQASINGNTSGAFQQQFFYSGARAHLQGRGFEGFATRRTSDSRTGLFEVDNLKQTFPHTGMRLQHSLLQSNQTTRVADSLATLAVRAFGNAGTQQRFFPYVQSVTDSQYELGGTLSGTLVSQAVTNYSFGDGFGNPTLISRTVTDKDPGSPYFSTSWTMTSSATYHNNASTNCLGLPQTIAETRAAPGKVAMTQTTSYGADTITCRITQQTLEPNAPEQKVTTTLEFDVCGNTNALRVVGARWDGVALPERVTRIDHGARCQLPESVTNPLGEVRRIGYRYEFGIPSSVIDGNGLVTSWQHDDFGRRISESRPDGTATAWAFDSCATQNCISLNAPYQRFHEREVSIGTQGNVYDQRDRYYDGRETLEWQTYTMPLGVSASDRFVYDGFSRITSRYAPASLQSNGYTSYGYDAVGRLQSVKVYNSSGALDRSTTIARAGRTTTVTDPLGHTRSFISDAAGQLRQVIDPSPGGTTTYEYDSIGNRSLVQDAIGAVSSGTFNQRGFRLAWKDADSGSWSFKTDSLGELVGWTDAKGQTFSASYDALGRVTSRTEPEGVSTWTWGNSVASHNVGRLWKASGYGHAEELTYDSIGRPATRKITTDQAYQYDYSYNSIGAIDTIVYPASPVPSGQTGTRFKARSYYSFGSPVSITDATDTAEKPLWALTASNAYGSATSESIGGVATVTSAYKAWTNELTSSQVGKSNTTDRQNLSFQWDAAGNLTQRQDLMQSNTEVFQFDSLNRVTNSTRNGASNLTVAYDAAGNISRKSDVSTAQYAYSNSSHPHAVTSAGSRIFTYDANGNQATRDGVIQTWASFNLPTALAQPIGGTTYTTQFSYGPDHQRWKQVANYSNGVETTQYLGGLLEKETTTSTGKTYWRHYVETPSGMVVVSHNSDATGSTRFVVSDQLGSSDVVLDASGNSITRASYGAFGARRGSDWTSTMPPDWLGIANSTRHGFTGHEHLDNVNLIHMGGRVYDPVVGRFLSVDPLVGDDTDSQSVNPYAYVSNRPLTTTDPTGYVGDSGSGPHGGFGFDWIGSLMAFMPGAKPYYPPASTLPGISVQSGGGFCGPGTLTAQCGGCFLSASGAGTRQNGVPTSTWSSQADEDALDRDRENIYRLFTDLGVNAVDVIILAPYHDGRAAYDAFRDHRYVAAAVYLGFTVCDIECKQLSLLFKPLVKAGKGLHAADKAATVAKYQSQWNVAD